MNSHITTSTDSSRLATPSTTVRAHAESEPRSGRSLPGNRNQGREWEAKTLLDPGTVLISTAIARMHDDGIRRMDRQDLLSLIRAAGRFLPRQDFSKHLPYMDLENLRKLACLARKSCRHHETSV